MNVSSGRIDVAPSALPSELDRIRREAADLDAEKEAMIAGKAAPRIRATLSNLVLLVSEKAQCVEQQAIEDLLTGLCVSHPSRFFVVRYDEAAELVTGVSSRCVLANSGKHICSEEVYVDVGAGSVELVPNLLLSLLVPDVQSALLVLCDPAAEEHAAGFGELLEGLASMSDVVVYDSSLFTSYAEGYRRIEGLQRLEPKPGFQGTVLRDGNWIRLRRWQELIVSQFDSQCFIEDASNVRCIRFHLPPGDCISTEAILLAGWCLGTLEWHCDSASSHEGAAAVLSCRDAAGGSTTLEFAVDNAGEDINALCRVDVEVETEGGGLIVSVTRLPGGFAELATCVTAAASGTPDSCDFSARRVPFVAASLEEIVVSRVGEQASSEARQRGEQEAVNIADILSGHSA